MVSYEIQLQSWSPQKIYKNDMFALDNLFQKISIIDNWYVSTPVPHS